MKLLIDTHFLVWLMQKPGEITPREQRVIDRANGSTHVSALSLWEIRLKPETLHRRGKRQVYPSAPAAHDFALALGFSLEPLTAAVCCASLQHPIDHHEPFDIMMLIHAEQLGARLLTRDEHMEAHPLALVP